MSFCDDLKLTLLVEYKKNIRNGAYGLIQKEFAYNSNRIEGSRLTKEHTSDLFETRSIYSDGEFKAKDIEEMTGHFVMFNLALTSLDECLSENLIKNFHKALKQGVFEDIANGYAIGDYKKRKNFVGDIETALPNEVPIKMNDLLSWYSCSNKTLEVLAEFHIRYERIHPFQDGNGRTGRIILFRECLYNDIPPFIVRDCNKSRYINALRSQDITALVDYFKYEQAWLFDKLDGSLIESYEQWASYFRKIYKGVD